MKKTEEPANPELDAREPEAAEEIQKKMTTVEIRPSPANRLSAWNSMLQKVKPFGGPVASASSSGSATGNPRNKTALAPGHSLMDWIRLGNSGVDLTGVGGVPRVVSLSELANHNKQTDAWIAIRGIVFNVTRYMDFHPGGVNELMRGVGKDATKLFENVHAWVNYQSILQKCVVGRLSRVSSAASTTLVPENTAANSSDCSPTTANLIRSCTAARNVDQSENGAESELPNVTMDWRQTTKSITLFHQPIRDHTAVGYQLRRISGSKVLFKLVFSKDIITYELEFVEDVEWPPLWKRDFETMQVDFTFTKTRKEVWKSQGSQTLSRESNANRRTYKEYEVVANIPLSGTVRFLVVRAKDSLEVIPVGRHVEAKLDVMGTEVSRYYTPVPPCLHQDDAIPEYKSDCLGLMIKRYPDGALSPSMTALQPGEFVRMSNALGAFVVESFDNYSTIHMLAGGTGLTAMLGIIQRALARRSVEWINLLNFNKDEDNMFYTAQLKNACVRSKLQVTHILSQPTEPSTRRRGTVSESLLKQLVGERTSDGCVFTCGPPGFVQAAKRSLEKLGWKSEQMHEFD